MRFRPVYGLAVVVIALLLGVAVAVGGASRSACLSCHRTVTEATVHGKHASVPCLQCHAPTLSDKPSFVWFQWTRMFPSRFAGKAPSGPVREIPRAACLSCHAAVLSTTVKGSLGIRINHEACAANVSCDSCHSAVAHGAATRWIREPVMEKCTACHVRENVPILCDTCHIGRSQSQRLAVGPWQVTHGRGWKTAHGMGDLESCSTCHPRDYCARCHGVAIPHGQSFGSEHGAFAMSRNARCQTCHKSQTFCSACHGVPMPHPSGFLKIHSSQAKTTDNPTCMRCHTQSDCLVCHERHIHPGGSGVPRVVAPAGRPQ